MQIKITSAPTGAWYKVGQTHTVLDRGDHYALMEDFNRRADKDCRTIEKEHCTVEPDKPAD